MKRYLPSLFVVLLMATSASAQSAARTLDLPARAIFSAGPNKWRGDVLEIRKGRGATIGWYISAQREEEVRVLIEYTCAKPLNQEYQISFDGQDRFWEVPVTKGEGWRQAELGVFRRGRGFRCLCCWCRHLIAPTTTR